MSVVFLRGMNTYGDDALHVGPFRFGLMHERIERALRARGVNITSLLKLGHGSPDELANRALEQLPEGSVTLLGHSIGGIVARAIAKRAPERVKQIITFGTPHEGTRAATLGLEFPKRHPGLTRVLSLAGYDTRTRAETFRHYTPEAMARFNEAHPSITPETTPEITPEISLICELPKEQLCLPYRASYRSLHPNAEPSDGFIHTASQRRGQTIGPFALDHFSQMGLHLYANPARAHAEFERLMQQIATLVSK